MPSHLEPAAAIAMLMRRIYRRSLTTTSGGNISLRDGDDWIWITPAGPDKGALRPEDIVCVNSDGPSVGQSRRPSSELPAHRLIYQARPDVRAIIHAHPPALVAFSIRHEAPALGAIPASAAICGPVGYVPYELTGTDALGHRIAAVFTSEVNCAVLENHGVIVGGPDLHTAMRRFETLEWTSAILLRAHQLARATGGSLLPVDDVSKCRADTLLAGSSPSSGPEGTRCEELIATAARAIEQQITTGALSRFSTRLDPSTFIATPASGILEGLSPRDLQRVGITEGARADDATIRLHAAVYRSQPEDNAVLQAVPVHASAFAITDIPLDCRTIPESYILLREVPDISRAVQRDAPNRTAISLTLRRPAALLQHAGPIVVGHTLLDAFDRLEVLEFTATSLFDAQLAGGVESLCAAAIDELDRAFPS